MPVDWSKITKPDELPGPAYLASSQDIDGRLWLTGRGTKPNRVMIVGQNPGRTELRDKVVFVGASGQLLMQFLLKTGLRQYDPYITNVVKYGTIDNATPKVSDLKNCLNCLLHEIDEVQPELIITLGARALEGVAGKQAGNRNYTLSDYRSEFLEVERLPGVKIFAMWHPAYVLRRPELEGDFESDMLKAIRYLNGEPIEQGAIAPFALIESAGQFAEWLFKLYDSSDKKSMLLSLDSEWQGQAPELGGYLRTLQVGGAGGTQSCVVRLFPTSTPDSPIDPNERYPYCADTRQVLQVLNDFLSTVNNGGVFGQNLISDGFWFQHYGFDIRPYTAYDTMLAEHLLDNRGPFGLTDLTLKYAPQFGRYDRWIKEWLGANKEAAQDGFGCVPEAVLFPYAAGDVQVTWEIMRKQYTQLAAEGYLEPADPARQYPSLLEIVIRLSLHLYEVHSAGMQVDPQRLQQLTGIFNNKFADMRIKLGELGAKHGFSDFNPNSPQQKQKLLFGSKEEGGLGLIPVKTTGKPSKSWEWVKHQPEEIQARYKPSTDSETLETLEMAHPIVKALVDYSRVWTVCKSFLREDKTGGINGSIWPDGKIHSEFSQLTETGRLRTRKPNCQNFPKAAEGALAKIFTDDREKLVKKGELAPGEPWPPSIRSVFVAEPGCILVEADYKQAELFVLAGMSGDRVMLDALTTPGKDLHDTTTISAFHVLVFMADGQTPYAESQLLALAKQDMSKFNELRDSLIYVDAKGHRMSREEFNSTLRVSGKAINFGIPYGRGPEAIATQINAETGLKIPVDEIRNAVDGWRSAYPDAWLYMCACRTMAMEQGFVVNAWGRKRHFGRSESSAQEGQTQREASNFPIQSTVADTMAIAAERIVRQRNAQKLTFKTINQVHDAYLFSVPKTELVPSLEVIRAGMTGIGIPTPSGPLYLDIDIDTYHRWGEKGANPGVKQAETTSAEIEQP